jgi:hypothetical protein
VIGETVLAALRSAVQTTRARIAGNPERWRFKDDDARVEAIAKLATDVVLRMLQPELVAHVSRGKLLHAARVEIYRPGYGVGKYGVGKYGNQEGKRG